MASEQTTKKASPPTKKESELDKMVGMDYDFDINRDPKPGTSVVPKNEGDVISAAGGSTELPNPKEATKEDMEAFWKYSAEDDLPMRTRPKDADDDEEAPTRKFKKAVEAEVEEAKGKKLPSSPAGL